MARKVVLESRETQPMVVETPKNIHSYGTYQPELDNRHIQELLLKRKPEHATPYRKMVLGRFEDKH